MFNLKTKANICSFALLLCVTIFGTLGEEAPNCKEKGFDPASLFCSSCNALKEFVNDEGIYQDCRQCCIEDGVSDIEQKKFVKAVLVVDNWRLAGYPQLKQFIDKEWEQHKFPPFSVRWVNGAEPKLILTDTDGGTQHLSISGWKTENLEEFLSTTLVNEEE